jgi:hypothetical protein
MPCSACGAIVSVKDTIYTAGGELVCRMCHARTLLEAPSPAVRSPSPALVGTRRGDLLLGLTAPAVVFPILLGAFRLVCGLAGVSDVNVVAFSSAVLAWFAVIGAAAALSFVRWRRPRLGVGLIVSLVVLLVTGGALVLLFIIAAASAIRG